MSTIDNYYYKTIKLTISTFYNNRHMKTQKCTYLCQGWHVLCQSAQKEYPPVA